MHTCGTGMLLAALPVSKLQALYRADALSHLCPLNVAGRSSTDLTPSSSGLLDAPAPLVKLASCNLGVAQRIHAHVGPVLCIAVWEDKLIFSGSTDCLIKVGTNFLKGYAHIISP